MKTEVELRADLKTLDLMVKQYAEASKTFIVLKTAKKPSDERIRVQTLLLQKLQTNIENLAAKIKVDTLALNPFLLRNTQAISKNNPAIIKQSYIVMQHYQDLRRKVQAYNDSAGKLQSNMFQHNASQFTYILYALLAFACLVLVIHGLTTSEIQYLGLHVGVIGLSLVLLFYNTYESVFARIKSVVIYCFELLRRFFEV
jgi:hypothetical protein